MLNREKLILGQALVSFESFLFSFKIRVNIFFYQTPLLELINFYIEHLLLKKLKILFTDLITSTIFYAFILDFSHLNGFCVVQEEKNRPFLQYNIQIKIMMRTQLF